MRRLGKRFPVATPFERHVFSPRGNPNERREIAVKWPVPARLAVDEGHEVYRMRLQKQ